MSAGAFTLVEQVGGARIGSALALCLLVIACSGCGPTTSTVSGRVTMDGKPLAITDDARGTVVFHPAGGQGATATGLLDRTGNFFLSVGASSNIVPGRYQVAVSVVELVPAADGGEPRGQRVTPAKYSSAIDSGLQADVALGENRFTFDLSSAEDQAAAASPAAESEGDASAETPIKEEAATEAVVAPTPEE
jgi:hypothetical protein